GADWYSESGTGRPSFAVGRLLSSSIDITIAASLRPRAQATQGEQWAVMRPLGVTCVTRPYPELRHGLPAGGGRLSSRASAVRSRTGGARNSFPTPSGCCTIVRRQHRETGRVKKPLLQL